ncbi:MAG: hypothetical protein IPI67_25670 [Myxococcales bacterium]|nr:hypothetical protein [Myxococcales bacterium]
MRRQLPLVLHAVVVALGVLALSVLQAHALSTLIAGALGPPALRIESGDRATALRPAVPQRPLTAAELGAAWGSRSSESHGLAGEQACPGIAARIITESADPTWSLATLTDQAGQARLVRIGDHFGDRTVSFIGHAGAAASPSVWLERNESRCRAELSLISAAQSTPVAASRARPSPQSPAVAPAAARFSLGGARFVRAPNGFRLLGVRAGSLLASIGLVEGDLVTQLNGADARRPESALLALAGVRQGKELGVTVERGGRTLVLHYRLR